MSGPMFRPTIMHEAPDAINITGDDDRIASLCPVLLDGRPYFPARDMQLMTMFQPGGGGGQIVLALTASFGGLAIALTPAVARLTAEKLLKLAESMEADAAAQLQAVLDRAPRRDGNG